MAGTVDGFARARAPWWVLGAVLLILSGLLGLDLYLSHHAVADLERERLTHAVDVIDANVSRQLATTGAELALLREELPSLLGPQADKAHAERRLQALTEAMNGVRSLSIVSSGDTVVASSREALLGQSFRDSGLSSTLRQGGDPAMLYASPPFVTPLGIYTIGLAKVVLDAQGKFDGYVLAVVDPEYFGTVLKSALYGPEDMRTGLVHDSGRLFYRFPDPEKLVGRDPIAGPQSLLMQHRRSGQATSMLEATAAATGEHRVAAYRTINPASAHLDRPLVAYASREHGAIYAPWRKEAAARIGILLALAAVSVAGLLFYQRRQADLVQLRAAREAERAQAQERMRLATDGADVGIWYWDLRTDTLEFSDRAKAHLAQPAGQDPTLDRFYFAVHPDDRARVEALVNRAVERRADYEAEYRVVHLDGRTRWIHAMGRVYCEPDGRIRAMGGVTVDITARKETETALQTSEARYRELFEANPHPMWVYDRETLAYLAVNDAAIAKYGYRRDEFLAMTVADLRPPEEMPRLREYVAALVEGTDDTALWRHRCKDGREILAEVTARSIQFAGRPAVIAHAHDVTERQRLAEELDRHHRELEDLVRRRTAELEEANRVLARRADEIADLYDGAPCGYHALAADGTILSANRTELEMLGYAKSEYVGHAISEFMTPESVAALRDRFAEFKQTGRVRDLPCDMVRKDGTTLPVLISANTVRGANGEFLYNRATMVDNRERKQREREIAAMQDELARRTDAAEAATAAKSAFLANMSHELRTPLHAILGYTYLLRQADLGPTETKHLDRIESAGRHLLEVVSDVLDFSKIEAGDLRLTQGDFGLRELLDGVRSMIERAAAEKGLAVSIVADDVPDGLHGDAQRLRQALLNYASNAVKFTAHGSVTLRASVLEEQGDGLLLRFEVQDTGIGIAGDRQGELFQPFQQVDASMTRAAGGTGLGLAITRRLAELMGGGVGVSSEPGAGSTFWFTARLSRARQPLETTIPQVSTAKTDLAARFAGARVLAADDDAISRDLLVALLEGTGLVIDVARSGKLAVEMARETSYDVILLDLQMPEMGGLEAAGVIRALPGRGDVPIVAVTANVLSSIRRACLDAGMSGFIGKPFEARQFYATLYQALALRAGIDRALPTPALLAGPSSGGGVSPPPEVPIDLTEAASYPGIDVARGLQAWSGKVAYANYLRKFAANFGQCVTTMRSLAPAESRRLAHKVKGAAANVALADVAHRAEILERCLAEHGSAVVALDDLQAALDVALRSIERFASDHPDTVNVTAAGTP